MEVTVEVAARHPADEVRSLRQWLLGEDALRGRVRLLEPSVEPGNLGALADTLAVVLGPGGIATAAASVLIAWIRRRSSDVKLKVTRPDGSSFELDAVRMSALDAAGLRDLTAQLSAALDAQGEDTAG